MYIAQIHTNSSEDQRELQLFLEKVGFKNGAIAVKCRMPYLLFGDDGYVGWNPQHNPLYGPLSEYPVIPVAIFTEANKLKQYKV